MATSAITYQLSEFSFVRQFLLKVDQATGSYALTLVLSESDSPEARVISAAFEGVCRLTLRDFGGGGPNSSTSPWMM